MQFDFSKVLTRAGQIIWRFKVLWVFGILASCARGGSSGAGANITTGSGSNDFNGSPPEFPRFLADVPAENFWVAISLIVVGVICIALILSIIFFAIRTIGRLGIIQGTLLAEAGAESLSFMQLFNAGKPYFMRALVLNFIVVLAGLGIGLVIGIPVVLIAILTFGIGLLCLIPLLVLIAPISILVQVIVEQANIALVVEDLDAIAALQKGWKVVRNDWGPAIIIGLIMLFARMIVGAIVVMPIFFAFGPLIVGLIGGGIGESIQLMVGGAAVTLLCICSLLPFLLAIGGGIEAYVESAWTLTYIQLTGHEPSLPELEAGTA